jgi:hypothetical protein
MSTQETITDARQIKKRGSSIRIIYLLFFESALLHQPREKEEQGWRQEWQEELYTKQQNDRRMADGLSLPPIQCGTSTRC